MILPDTHYAQVQATLEAFERDFFGATTEKVSSNDKIDAVAAQARKFLREHKASFTKNKEVKNTCDKLIDLLEKGTHTPLPNEVRQLNRKITKREITLAQGDNLILLLAKKYDVAAKNEEDEFGITTDSLPVIIEPDIVISETFI